MEKKSAVWIWHVAGWLLYLVFPLFFFRYEHIIVPGQMIPFITGHLFHSFWVIALFYFNYLYAVPMLLLNDKRLIFFLLNILLTGISHLLLIRLHYQLMPHLHPGTTQEPPVNPLITLILFGVIIPTGFRLYQRLQQTEKQRTEMELSYLKSRLNPHFLFNTLNSVYALAVRKSDQAPDAIARLAAIMRYVITESEAREVLLEKELNYIRDFISLQRLRLTEKTTIDFRVEGITAGKMIVPLLLISFVENAFKYGVSTEQDSTITIHIDIRGDYLNLNVVNSVLSKPEPGEGKGLGLGSARQLLDHFYKGKSRLKAEESGHKYYVDLHLELA